jgi:hypothetical protein
MGGLQGSHISSQQVGTELHVRGICRSWGDNFLVAGSFFFFLQKKEVIICGQSLLDAEISIHIVTCLKERKHRMLKVQVL